MCLPYHIGPVPHYLARFDTDSPADISDVFYWEGSGGGCGLVEGTPSLDESARAAFKTKGEGASRWRPKLYE
jgi:hypothetical protein